MGRVDYPARRVVWALTALSALWSPSLLAQPAAGPLDNDLAGPVVRASLDRVANALSRANLTVDAAEKKKTIAQIFEEVLEQEFPEEKPDAIGKNYNETAKQDDVSFAQKGTLSVCSLQCCCPNALHG